MMRIFHSFNKPNFIYEVYIEAEYYATSISITLESFDMSNGVIAVPMGSQRYKLECPEPCPFETFVSICVAHFDEIEQHFLTGKLLTKGRFNEPTTDTITDST